MSAEDERQLLLRAAEGSMDAFRSLVETHMRHAYRIAYGIVNDHAEAEDVAQEAFVRVHQSLGSFRGESRFSTWLYRIVTNLSLNRKAAAKSRMKREVPMTAMLVQPSVAPDAGESAEIQSSVERALHELPTMQRVVVILRHINGLSTKQVGSILSCSDGTVKTHLHRGLKRMKSLLSYMENDIA